MSGSYFPFSLDCHLKSQEYRWDNSEIFTKNVLDLDQWISMSWYWRLFCYEFPILLWWMLLFYHLMVKSMVYNFLNRTWRTKSEKCIKKINYNSSIFEFLWNFWNSIDFCCCLFWMVRNIYWRYILILIRTKTILEVQKNE